MTETLPNAQTARDVTIRAYRPSDHGACRRLWAELTEHQRDLFGDPQLGGRDPGAGFEEYLTRLDLSGMWVADHREDGVGGFVGLILEGRSGEVDPVVVAESMRGQGVGRALLARVEDEARARGLHRLSVSPAARDPGALHTVYAAGFTRLSTVTLTIELRAGADLPADGDLDLHGLRFTL